MPEPDLHPDDSILKQLAANDPRAIDRLHALYYRRLFFAIRKFVQNDQDTATLLNDLLVTLWEKRHTLKPRKPLLYYLYRAARNRAINFLRSKSRIQEIPLGPETVFQAAEDGSNAADYTVREADLVRLWQAAEQLMPYRVREAFVLSRQDGLTPEEIAQTMNITVSGARKNLARAWKVIEAVKKLYFGFVLILIV